MVRIKNIEIKRADNVGCNNGNYDEIRITIADVKNNGMEKTYLEEVAGFIVRKLELYTNSKNELTKEQLIGECKGILRGLLYYADTLQTYGERVEIRNEYDALYTTLQDVYNQQ